MRGAERKYIQTFHLKEKTNCDRLCWVGILIPSGQDSSRTFLNKAPVCVTVCLAAAWPVAPSGGS